MRFADSIIDMKVFEVVRLAEARDNWRWRVWNWFSRPSHTSGLRWTNGIRTNGVEFGCSADYHTRSNSFSIEWKHEKQNRTKWISITHRLELVHSEISPTSITTRGRSLLLKTAESVTTGGGGWLLVPCTVTGRARGEVSPWLVFFSSFTLSVRQAG